MWLRGKRGQASETLDSTAVAEMDLWSLGFVGLHVDACYRV